MNENLPFYSCNDDEFTNIISLENNTSNDQSITMTASVTNEIKLRKSLAQYMPFYTCSDYVIQSDCIKVKNNLYKLLKIIVLQQNVIILLKE